MDIYTDLCDLLDEFILVLSRLIGSVSLQESMGRRELAGVEDGTYLPIYSRGSRENEPVFTCKPYRSFWRRIIGLLCSQGRTYWWE